MNTSARARNSILGAGIGVGLMFLLDPAHGARRRALVKDKLTRVSHKTRDAVGATRRDVANRMAGVRAWARNLYSAQPVDDRALLERVRARLGRVASHPRAIDVTARGGCVTLTGDVVATEIVPIISAIARVRGVRDVENEMTAHPSTEGVPSLQGESERPDHRAPWPKPSWSPAGKIVSGAVVMAALGAIAARKPAVRRSSHSRWR